MVVSPLKVLMLDQVRLFSTKGVNSVYVSDSKAGEACEAVTTGSVSLIFL